VAGKRVLIIDDDAMNLEGLGGLLASWGCRVVTASSCEQALDRLAAEQLVPDIVISDYQLADGITGDQAIARLRDRFGQLVPAFLMSGDTSSALLLAAKASGFQLLHKPVPPMKLRLMLNQLLKNRNVVGADS
jgi:CheY-like chemotaxis protein